MTSRKRFIDSLTRGSRGRSPSNGGEVDRLFRYEHGTWATTRERWIGEGYPPDANFTEYFDLDPIVRIMINSGFTNSPYHPKFEETTLTETPDHRTYTDIDGVTKKELKQQSDTSMPQFIKFPVTDRNDWKQILKRLNPTDAPARIGDAEELVRRCANPDVPTMLPICGAFGHPRNLLGDEGLSYIIYDDPKLLEEILANWYDLYFELIRRLASHVRIDSILIWEDMCYKNGPLIDPEHFRRFMLPKYKQLIETDRGVGVEAIIVDTDGDCLQMIPLFLEAGADAMMPFEVQAGMDVVEIRRRFPSLGILGGLDKRALAKDKDAIKREVDRVVPHFIERGGFIPTLDHTVPPDVSLQNFKYYLECIRGYE